MSTPFDTNYEAAIALNNMSVALAERTDGDRDTGNIVKDLRSARYRFIKSI